MGVLETAWTGLAHSLNHFSAKPCFDAKTTSENVKKNIILKKSHIWHSGFDDFFEGHECIIEKTTTIFFSIDK